MVVHLNTAVHYGETRTVWQKASKDLWQQVASIFGGMCIIDLQLRSSCVGYCAVVVSLFCEYLIVLCTSIICFVFWFFVMF